MDALVAKVGQGGWLQISAAPGFSLGNVHVMAGVPAIFQVMVEALLPRLTGGDPVLSETVRIDRPEGDIASPLATLADEFDGLSFGSYPFIRDGRFGSNIVIRGTSPDALTADQKMAIHIETVRDWIGQSSETHRAGH